MICPLCRIDSMHVVPSGEVEVDRCPLCGALWFDLGEMGELAEGRLDGAVAAAPAPEEGGEGGAAAAGSPPGRKEELPLPRRLAEARALARTLSCPRCGVPLGALDYQLTGVPVISCRACRGILVPRETGLALSLRFRHFRENREAYERMGETLAEEVRRRERIRWGPAQGRPLPAGSIRPGMPPIPLVAPLGATPTGAAEEAERAAGGERFFPYATVAIAALLALVFLAARLGGAPGATLLPGGLPGLPAGRGLGAVPLASLPLSLFLHGGVVPLVLALLFLVVLGDDVEARTGPFAFLGLFFLWGVAAAAAHLSFGGPAGYPALGAWGAAAGILGAYLVFFPNVQVTVLGWGGVSSVPAYLFAVAWLAVLFFFGPGARLSPVWEAITGWVLPGQLSLQGSLAGFAAGALSALAWRRLGR